MGASVKVDLHHNMTRKILVADDEPLMHRLLQHHLERAGFQLVSATTGREALNAANTEHPSLIVMDVMMEDVDGISALRSLRKSEETRSIPVIVMTANPLPIVRTESEAAGASVFMSKPFSPAQLLAAIRKLIPETTELQPA
jgi:CheY-like chemotaxis protein